MIEYDKKIAQQTLNILMKKSWNTFSLEQVLKNVKVKKAYIKTKFDLLKPIGKYVDHLLINNTKSNFIKKRLSGNEKLQLQKRRLRRRRPTTR